MTEQMLRVRTMKKVYDCGLKFSQKVADNIDRAMHRVFILNKASMIVVDGGVGEGKTTFAEQICMHATKVFNEKHSEDKEPIEYEREKQLAMGGEDFLEKMGKYSLEKPVMIYDESGDFTGKRALSTFNFRINRVFETYRATKTLVVLILPTFFILDNTLLYNKIPRMLFHLEKRSLNQGKIKGYSLWRMFYLKDKAKKLVNPLQCYGLVDANFRANFLNHDTADDVALAQYSLQGKAKIHKEIFIQQAGLMSVKNIARELKVSVGYIRTLLSKKKIKEDYKIGNRKFYDPDILRRFRND